MLATHFGEGLVSPLDDPLRSDVNPAAGRHLAVHHQSAAIELVEDLPIRPFGHEIRVGDQHSRSVPVGGKHADRLARLDEQGLVFLEALERLDDLVEALPVARRSANSAIDDQALRILGNLVVEIVHQHSDRGFGRPLLRLDLAPSASADVAAVVASVIVHNCAP
jgi:AcrR family transcriptional regulator